MENGNANYYKELALTAVSNALEHEFKTVMEAIEANAKKGFFSYHYGDLDSATVERLEKLGFKVWLVMNDYRICWG